MTTTTTEELTVTPEELQQSAPMLAAALEAALDHEASEQDLQLLALAGLKPRLPDGATLGEPRPLSVDARDRVALAGLAGDEIRWVRERYAVAAQTARSKERHGWPTRCAARWQAAPMTVPGRCSRSPSSSHAARKPCC